jgi:hypothetical protein
VFDRGKLSSLYEDHCFCVKVNTGIPPEFPILEGTFSKDETDRQELNTQNTTTTTF